MCVFASLFVASCGAPHITEADAVKLDKIEFDVKDQQLHVVGLCFSGFYLVDRVSTMQHGSDIVVEMRLTMTRKSLRRKGMTGSFDIYIPVPPDARRVVFGTERTVIWERPSGDAVAQ